MTFYLQYSLLSAWWYYKQGGEPFQLKNPHLSLHVHTEQWGGAGCSNHDDTTVKLENLTAFI